MQDEHRWFDWTEPVEDDPLTEAQLEWLDRSPGHRAEYERALAEAAD